MVLVLLSGCAAMPAGSERAELAGLDWPARPDRVDEARIFQVDTERSELRVIVAPAGSLARLGHHHVIGGAVWSGELVVGESVFADLAVTVDALEVDRSAWRRDEGLDSIDEEAIDGTRRNLLGPKVLDAENHPRIEIRSIGRVGPEWQADVTARVRVRGRVSEWRVPVTVHRQGGRMIVGGALDIDQTALGLDPFSAAGGALRVADRMRVRFRIVAVASGD
jgi:hypothetical protein